LSQDVNDFSASLIVAQLLFLEAQAPDKDIQFYVNSPGGSVTSGLAIYDTMQYHYTVIIKLSHLVCQHNHRYRYSCEKVNVVIQ